jgi:serine/threonine protein kinase
VYEASDILSSVLVAVKHIRNIYGSHERQKVLREIHALNDFRHPNVAQLLDLHVVDSTRVFIMMHLSDSDLGKVIQSRQGLILDQRRRLTTCMMRGLSYIHLLGFVHRDVKPSNILVYGNCTAKVGDLGSIRYIGHGSGFYLAGAGLDETATPLTTYMVTRWYRAPELLLGCRKYDRAVDSWAAGCVIAEMINQTALLPGENIPAQLQLIWDFYGVKDEVEWTNLSHFNISESDQRLRSKLETTCPDAHPDELALLTRLLDIDPQRRLSITNAMGSPYIVSFEFPPGVECCVNQYSIGFGIHKLTAAFTEANVAVNARKRNIWALPTVAAAATTVDAAVIAVEVTGA